jgi:protein phosphatase
MKRLEIPHPSLVVLIGPSGSGKTSFARRNFAREEVVSTDGCRKLLTGREEFDAATNDAALELFHTMIDERLAAGKLAVADSTALLPIARRRLLSLAEKHGVPVVALIFGVDFQTCLRNDSRRPRNVGARIIEEQFRDFEEARELVRAEDFEILYDLSDGRRRGRRRIERWEWSWFPPSG